MFINLSFGKNTLAYFLAIMLLIFVSACSNSNAKIDETKVEQITDELIESINRYEYTYLKSLISETAFKKNATSSGTEKSIYKYVMEKMPNLNFRNKCIDVVNLLKFNNGEASLSNIIHTETYSQFWLTCKYNNLQEDSTKTGITFIAFKIENVLDEHKITDVRNIIFPWISEATRSCIKTNIKHNGADPIRYKANEIYSMYSREISKGNYSKAIKHIKTIPKPFYKGCSFCNEHLESLFGLSAVNFPKELEEYVKMNPSDIWSNYFYHSYYKNYEELRTTLNQVNDIVNQPDVIDSIYHDTYYWQ